MLRAGAWVTVVAPKLSEQLSQWAAEKRMAHRQAHFAPSDLKDCILVIAATNDKSVNEQISKLA
ncbi:hypothetical protein BGS_1129 [Beggiatoa sp. SS]|nr:hypothetical protein BGS_1129 [Beggiatoa sp. SS]